MKKLRKTVYIASGIVMDVVAVCVVLMAMLAIHLFLITPHTGQRQETAAVEQLTKQWSTPKPDTPPVPIGTPEYGETFATARIPRLGEDWAYSIKATTTLENLRTGIAWYSGTSLPGVSGNFALAAHRDGSTAPFAGVDTLKTCDEITVDTAGGTYTYTVLPTEARAEETERFAECAPEVVADHPETTDGTISGMSIVEPTAVNVVAPTPGGSFEEPATASWLTLTSCHPHFSNAERIIIHAILTDAHGRD